MPKKKVNPTEEPEQTPDELVEQAGTELPAPPEEPPQDADTSDESPPPELMGTEENALEAMALAIPPAPSEDWPPLEPPDAVPGATPMDGQEPARSGDEPVEAVTPPESKRDKPSAPPMTDRQSFFALDFREMDRGLTAEERQAWNSIYASYRGRSALSGKIIGADPHSMNVRNKETGQVERRTMYCVVVLVYRVPVYIPATEMWAGEARPDYVLQNMMGAGIDFIITKVDRKGGYAIASRRQAARAQRYFFAHRPDLCREGARVKCRMLSVGPRRCLVECYGHDIGLTQRELSYTAIADLREQYHPGDELDCVVKRYDAARRELEISVKETESNPFDGAELRHPVGSRRYAVIAVKETESNPFDGAELRHPVGSRRYAVIAGKYGGGVFCNLPDGTVCMCNYSYQHEDSDFQAGDSVMLVVQRFETEKRQMYGKILSKW